MSTHKKIKKLLSSESGEFVSITKHEFEEVFDLLFRNKIGSKLFAGHKDIVFDIDIEYFLSNVAEEIKEVLDTDTVEDCWYFEELFLILVYFNKFEDIVENKKILINQDIIDSFEEIEVFGIEDLNVLQNLKENIELLLTNNRAQAKREALFDIKLNIFMQEDILNDTANVFSLITDDFDFDMASNDNYASLYLIKKLSKHVDKKDEAQFLNEALKYFVDIEDDISEFLVDTFNSINFDAKKDLDTLVIEKLIFSPVGIKGKNSIVEEKISSLLLADLFKNKKKMLEILKRYSMDYIADLPAEENIYNPLFEIIFNDFHSINYKRGNPSFYSRERLLETLANSDEKKDLLLNFLNKKLEEAETFAKTDKLVDYIDELNLSNDENILFDKLLTLSDKELMDNIGDIFNEKKFNNHQKMDVLNKLLPLMESSKDPISFDDIDKITDFLIENKELSFEENLELKLRLSKLNIEFSKWSSDTIDSIFEAEEMIYLFFKENNSPNFDECLEFLKVVREKKFHYDLTFEQTKLIHKNLTSEEDFKAMYKPMIFANFKPFDDINSIKELDLLLQKEAQDNEEDDYYEKDYFKQLIPYNDIISERFMLSMVQSGLKINDLELKNKNLVEVIIKDIKKYINSELINFILDNGSIKYHNSDKELVKSFSKAMNIEITAFEKSKEEVETLHSMPVEISISEDGNKIDSSVISFIDGFDLYSLIRNETLTIFPYLLTEVELTDFVMKKIDDISPEYRISFLSEVFHTEYRGNKRFDYDLYGKILFENMSLNELNAFIGKSVNSKWDSIQKVIHHITKHYSMDNLETVSFYWNLLDDFIKDERVESYQIDGIIKNVLSHCEKEEIVLPDFLTSQNNHPLIQKRLGVNIIDFNNKLSADDDENMKQHLTQDFIDYVKEYDSLKPYGLIHKIKEFYKSGYLSIKDISDLVEANLSEKSKKVFYMLHNWFNIFDKTFLNDVDFETWLNASNDSKRFLKIKESGLDDSQLYTYSDKLIEEINVSQQKAYGADDWRHKDKRNSWFQISEQGTPSALKILRSSEIYASYNSKNNPFAFFAVSDVFLGEKSALRNINRFNKIVMDYFKLTPRSLENKKYKVISNLNFEVISSTSLEDIVKFLEGLQETLISLEENGCSHILFVGEEIFPDTLKTRLKEIGVSLAFNRGSKEFDLEYHFENETQKVSDAKSGLRELLPFHSEFSLSYKEGRVSTLIENLNDDIENVKNAINISHEELINSRVNSYFYNLLKERGSKASMEEHFDSNPVQLAEFNKLVNFEFEKALKEPSMASTNFINEWKVNELNNVIKISDENLLKIRSLLLDENFGKAKEDDVEEIGNQELVNKLHLVFLNYTDMNEYFNIPVTLEKMLNDDRLDFNYSFHGRDDIEKINYFLQFFGSEYDSTGKIYSKISEMYKYDLSRKFNGDFLQIISDKCDALDYRGEIIKILKSDNFDLKSKVIALFNNNTDRTVKIGNFLTNNIRKIDFSIDDIELIINSSLQIFNTYEDTINYVKDVVDILYEKYIDTNHSDDFVKLLVKINNSLYTEKNYKSQNIMYEVLKNSKFQYNTSEVEFFLEQWVNVYDEYQRNLNGIFPSSYLKDDNDIFILSQDYVQNTFADFIDYDFFKNIPFISYVPKDDELFKLFRTITTPEVVDKYGDSNQAELDDLNKEVAEFIEIKKIYASLNLSLKKTKSEKKKNEIQKEIDSLNYDELKEKISKVESKFKRVWGSWYKDINLKLSIFNNSIVSSYINKKRLDDSYELPANLSYSEFDKNLFKELTRLSETDIKEWNLNDFEFITHLDDNQLFIASMAFGIDMTNRYLVSGLFRGESSEILERLKSFDLKKYLKLKSRFISLLGFDFSKEFSDVETQMIEKLLNICDFDFNSLKTFGEMMNEYSFDLDSLHYINIELARSIGIKEYMKYFKKILEYLRKVSDNFTISGNFDDIRLAMDNIDFVQEKLGSLSHSGNVLFNTAKLKSADIDNSQMMYDTLHAFSSASLNDVQSLNISNESENTLNSINESLESFYDNEDEVFNHDSYFFGKKLYKDPSDGEYVMYETISPFDTRTYCQGYATSSCLTPDGVSANILRDMSKNPLKWSTLLLSKSKGNISDNVIQELGNLIDEYNNKLISGVFDNDLYSQIKSINQRYFYTTGASATWKKESQATFDNMETNVKTFVEVNGSNVRINKSEKYVVDAIKDSAKNGILYSQLQIFEEMKEYYFRNKNFNGYSFSDKPLFFTIGSGYSDIDLNTFNKKITNKNSLLENTNVYTDARREQQHLVDKHASIDFDNMQKVLDYFESFKKEENVVEALEKEIAKIQKEIQSHLGLSSENLTSGKDKNKGALLK